MKARALLKHMQEDTKEITKDMCDLLNDLLTRDFHISALMGPEGVRNWQAYLDLRKQIRRAPEADKPALVARALDIAERYGFAPPPEPAAT